MRYRYRDPTKIPAWRKYGRIGLLLSGIHVTGYLVITRFFGKRDGSSSVAEINSNIKEVHLRSIRAFQGEVNVKYMKLKGLSFVPVEDEKKTPEDTE